MPIKPYDHTTYPTNGALGSSSALRNELDAIETGFDMVATEIETALTGSETAAVTAVAKAAEALASANNADISEAAAAASAAAALVSQNAAAASESNVVSLATQVANTYDSFDDRYLGAKDAAPTFDNDGNALQVGTLYFDTTLVTLRGYNGAAWVNLPATTASNIANTPSGSLAAITVQAALNELDADLTATNSALSNHLSDAADAHDASAISYLGSANLSATDVEAALDELDTEKLSNADGAVTNAKLAFDGGALGFRNKIIGGDFTTNPWKRGTSFASVIDGKYTADRFQYSFNTSSVVTINKTADAPTAAQAGVFTQHCLHVDVTTADVSTAASDFCLIGQKIEGLNATSFGFGQAGTRYVTLSFWHKHTKTGIYCVSFINSATNRSYVAEYTQAVSDLWEKAEIAVPVDTTGTWLYDNGIGLRVSFAITMGTTYHTSPNIWQAGNFLSTINQVNALDNVANNFKIALVQLEAGSTATPFENRHYGTEFELCARYCEIIGGTPARPAFGTASAYSTTSVFAYYKYRTQKRVSPTISFLTGSDNQYRFLHNNGATNTSSINFSADAIGVLINAIVASATVGSAGQLEAQDSLFPIIQISAEL